MLCETASVQDVLNVVSLLGPSIALPLILFSPLRKEGKKDAVADQNEGVAQQLNVLHSNFYPVTSFCMSNPDSAQESFRSP